MLALFAAAALAASPEFSFGFTNQDGTLLLALSPVNNAAGLTQVVCDGRALEVRYLREQAKGEQDTGRQTARNFTQTKGALFKVKGAAAADALCLLGSKAAFKKRTLLSVTTETGSCDEKTSALAGSLTGRDVERCFSTGSFPGGRLAFASYKLDGSSALAAVLVVPEKGTPAVRKFPAEWERGAPSCWRADDGCEFDASSYRVAFAMSGTAGLELYALWAGAEGENAELLRVKGLALEVAASASRYWSPE